MVIASRNVDKCNLAAKEMNQYIQQHCSNGCKAVGTVVVGPSTSIRDEDQVNNLIEYIIDTYKALHLLEVNLCVRQKNYLQKGFKLW